MSLAKDLVGGSAIFSVADLLSDSSCPIEDVLASSTFAAVLLTGGGFVAQLLHKLGSSAFGVFLGVCGHGKMILGCGYQNW